MSPAAFAGVLVVTLGVLAVVLNHCHARLALIELTLNEGLPPGHEATLTQAPATGAPSDLIALLGSERDRTALHVFLSRNCHACQRLLEELDAAPLGLDADVHLRYVDRPRPLATSAAERQSAQLTNNEAELAAAVRADPLPYTIALGPHGLVAGQVTPTLKQVAETAHNAGIASRLTSRQ